MASYTEIVEQAREAIGIRRVYGEAYEKNGVTVIPAAHVMGGGGGGEGTGPAPGDETGSTAASSGSGGGFGVSGRPAGAFVIKGDDVRWLPAVDVNRLMFGFQVVMIIFFLVVRSIAKSRAQAARAALEK